MFAKTFSTVLTLSLFFVCISCKKSNDSTKDKLTSVSCWNLTKYELFDPILNIWNDESVPPCLSDDCISFKDGGNSLATTLMLEGGVLNYDNSASKCDEDDVQAYEYGWWLDSADEITFSFIVESIPTPIGGNVMRIVEISDSKLVCENINYNRFTFEN